MGELLKQGIDLHWHFAASSLGMTYAAIRAAEKEYKEHRKRAKPANFGFPGGMGAVKFVLYSRGYGVVYTEAEAKDTKAKWVATFQEMPQYFSWISRQLHAVGGEFTHVHPITQFVRGGCRYTSGANHGFQHLCAYAAKDALWAVTCACFDPRSPLFGYRVWNFVHDEILLEGPIDTCHEAAIELSRIMEQAFNQWIPDCPTTADPFVTMIWSKKMEVTKDANGRYIPWAA
jgi:DNA polymerase-1